MLEPFVAVRMSSRHHASLVYSAAGAGGASRDRTDDLRVANATLSQLSYGPILGKPGTTHATRTVRVVGLGGVAPPTSPLSGVRSN